MRSLGIPLHIVYMTLNSINSVDGYKIYECGFKSITSIDHATI